MPSEPPRKSRSIIGWINRFATTDFCPNANKFVYWLKEPAGWFVMAIGASLLIGVYANSIGITLAIALIALLTIGMAWPAIAVWSASCELRPSMERVSEFDQLGFELKVTNRLPIPIWGLSVEGYLDGVGTAQSPTVALAVAGPLTESTFTIEVTPTLRGSYPCQAPTVACSFPFGVWTARRPLRVASKLLVWPAAFPMRDALEVAGTRGVCDGPGLRGSNQGDFLGVRDYRRGDSTKQIHWIATARSERLIVIERGSTQFPAIVLSVDTSLNSSRDQLSERLRVAASILQSLQRQGIEITLKLPTGTFRVTGSRSAMAVAMNALAMVPADGTSSSDGVTRNESIRNGTVTLDQGSRPVAGVSSETVVALKGDIQIDANRRGDTQVRLNTSSITQRNEQLFPSQVLTVPPMMNVEDVSHSLTDVDTDRVETLKGWLHSFWERTHANQVA